MKPRLFIGSATESVEIAYSLQETFDRDDTAEVTVWTQGVFDLSKSTLHSLLNELPNFAFAVFILGGEDVTKIRESTFAATRDNVIFELGLFTGYLGVDHTFFVMPRGISNLRMPTDLLGIGYATFDDARTDGRLGAALEPACRKIRKCMKECTERARPGEIRLYTFIGLLNKPPVESDDPSFQSFHYHYTQNQNPLANLWSDPRPGNSVTANLCKGSQPKYFLSVDFQSAIGCHAPAVGIHPEGLRARKITENYDRFRFMARLSLLREEKDACSTAIAMRLVRCAALEICETDWRADEVPASDGMARI